MCFLLSTSLGPFNGIFPGRSPLFSIKREGQTSVFLDGSKSNKNTDALISFFFVKIIIEHITEFFYIHVYNRYTLRHLAHFSVRLIAHPIYIPLLYLQKQNTI